MKPANTPAIWKRRCALSDSRNRGCDLTAHKRSRLNDLATQNRHCAQYVTNARRSGLYHPKYQ